MNPIDIQDQRTGQGMLKISRVQDEIDPRRSPQRKSSDGVFVNEVPNRRTTSMSEFKVHFYVKQVPRNGMSEDELLNFIKRKGYFQVSLAGPCEIVQLVGSLQSTVDVSIGMRNDDDAKLVYIGKKHFNFGRPGRSRENVELSEAFESYLDYHKIKDKDNLDRQLRKNIERGRGRSRSGSSSSQRRKSKSRSTKRRKDEKNRSESEKRQKKLRKHSSSSDSKLRRKKKYSDSESSQSRSHSFKRNIQQTAPAPILQQQAQQLGFQNPTQYSQPMIMQPQNLAIPDQNCLYVFAVPQEFSEIDVCQAITTYGLPPPLSNQWKTDPTEKIVYLELQFSDAKTVQYIQQLRPCFQVKSIPLLVIQKKNRPILELMRNYEIQVDLDQDTQAFNMYEEFKQYGDIIGLYVFNSLQKQICLKKNIKISYLLLYSSNSQLSDTLKPPVQKQISFKSGQTVNAFIKIAEKPIAIHRPKVQETLVYQLQSSNSQMVYQQQNQQLPANQTIQQQPIQNYDIQSNTLYQTNHIQKAFINIPSQPTNAYGSNNGTRNTSKFDNEDDCNIVQRKKPLLDERRNRRQRGEQKSRKNYK